MSKRTNTDITGYIHSVSPTKAKSFHFTIQDQSGSKPLRAICFDKGKYGALKDKRISGEPVKIAHAIHQKQSDNTRYAEIIVNKSSVVTDVDPVQLKFPRLEVEVSYVKLDEKELTVGETVSVMAAVDLKHSRIEEVMVGSKPKKVMNNVFLYNDTGVGMCDTVG